MSVHHNHHITTDMTTEHMEHGHKSGYTLCQYLYCNKSLEYLVHKIQDGAHLQYTLSPTVSAITVEG